MINATQMAKPFGKNPYEWLRLPSTIEFINALQNTGKSRILFFTVRGRNGGTWFHEDVALEFAKRLEDTATDQLMNALSNTGKFRNWI